MNMKAITLYTSILVMILCSFSAFAAESRLDQAIKHAEAAVEAVDGKTVAGHAEKAKSHAVAAKTEKTITKTAGSHVDEGIKNLDEAIKEGNLGAADLAKKAAKEAVTHLKQAVK